MAEVAAQLDLEVILVAELERDRLGVGDPLALHRGARGRQLDERSHRVIDFRCHPHRREFPTVGVRAWVVRAMPQ